MRKTVNRKRQKCPEKGTLVPTEFGIHTIRDITIRDMSINLKIDIIVLNLSYFMLCDDCQIATYVYILWYYLYNDDRGNKVLTGISNSLKISSVLYTDHR